MLYHGFDAADPDGGRKVYLDQIIWDKDGWPTVRNRTPSVTANAPLFGEAAHIIHTDILQGQPRATYSLGGLRLSDHNQQGIVIEHSEGGFARKIAKK